MTAREVGGHRRGRVALGRAVGLAHPTIDQQTVPVLHEDMADEQSLASSPCPCDEAKPRGRWPTHACRCAASHRGSRARRCGPARGRLAATILRAEALHGCPGLDQRAIDREVVIRQQHLDLWADRARHAGTWLRSPLPATGRGSW